MTLHQYNRLPYYIGTIIESMRTPTTMPGDEDVAFRISLKAAKLWTKEGLAAAEDYFETRVKAPIADPQDESTEDPLFEEIETGPNNIHQRDEEEDDQPDGEITEDLTREVEVAFESIRADAEALANQSQWTPLCDALNSFFSDVNALATQDENEVIAQPAVFAEQVEVMLNRPVFSRQGFIGVWEAIDELLKEQKRK